MDYEQISREMFDKTLEALGIDLTTSNGVAFLATSASTMQGHISTLEALADLQINLFKISVMINTAVCAEKNKQDEFIRAKTHYNMILSGLTEVFERHMENLTDSSLRVQSIKGLKEGEAAFRRKNESDNHKATK